MASPARNGVNPRTIAFCESTWRLTPSQITPTEYITISPATMAGTDFTRDRSAPRSARKPHNAAHSTNPTMYPKDAPTYPLAWSANHGTPTTPANPYRAIAAVARFRAYEISYQGLPATLGAGEARIVARYGARPFATGGMLGSALGFVLLALLPIDFDYWEWGMEKYIRAVAGFRSAAFQQLIDTVRESARHEGATP